MLAGVDHHLILLYSNACGILREGNVIITGGSGKAGHKVDEYGLGGFIQAWPQLQQPRLGHACGMINQVEMIKAVTSTNIEPMSQMLIVAGGKRGTTRLDCTEILRPSYSTWMYSAALPFTPEGLRGATISNNFYVTGGFPGPHTGELGCLPFTVLTFPLKRDSSLHCLRDLGPGGHHAEGERLPCCGWRRGRRLILCLRRNDRRDLFCSKPYSYQFACIFEHLA